MPQPILVEITPGELLDKIAILEIKCEQIADAEKLRNVRAELSVLKAARQDAVPASAELEALTAELKAVNALIFAIVDGMHLAERTGDFGPRFIDLARSVHQENDRRAALKRRINEVVGTNWQEEKAYPRMDGAG